MYFYCLNELRAYKEKLEQHLLASLPSPVSLICADDRMALDFFDRGQYPQDLVLAVKNKIELLASTQEQLTSLNSLLAEHAARSFDKIKFGCKVKQRCFKADMASRNKMPALKIYGNYAANAPFELTCPTYRLKFSASENSQVKLSVSDMALDYKTKQEFIEKKLGLLPEDEKSKIAEKISNEDKLLVISFVIDENGEIILCPVGHNQANKLFVKAAGDFYLKWDTKLNQWDLLFCTNQSGAYPTSLEILRTYIPQHIPIYGYENFVNSPKLSAEIHITQAGETPGAAPLIVERDIKQVGQETPATQAELVTSPGVTSPIHVKQATRVTLAAAVQPAIKADPSAAPQDDARTSFSL